MLFTVEKRYASLSLPQVTRERLGKWQDAVKAQVTQGLDSEGSHLTNNHRNKENSTPGQHSKDSSSSNGEAQGQARIVKLMECITVGIASPEEEPDPLDAALAAKRKEMLSDFSFFLRYRFRVELEPWLDLIHVAGTFHNFQRGLLAVDDFGSMNFLLMFTIFGHRMHLPPHGCCYSSCIGTVTLSFYHS